MNRRHFAHIPDAPTAAQARASMAMLLGGCTDAMLAGFTVDKLAAQFKVPPREIEVSLVVARQRRGL